MNRSIVTFTNPETNHVITINFDYNEENQTLDYNVKSEPEMVDGENYGFNLFLANFLLNNLLEKKEEKPKKATRKKKKIENESNTAEN